MFDDEAGRAFAAFVSSLLPRLLLYPGGLFTLLVAGVLPRLLPLVRPSATVTATRLPEAQRIPALALAWAGLALLPLPGLSPLPGGPDLLTPLGLLLAASWLFRPVPGSANQQGLGGYGLLLLAPLLALAQSPAGSLLLLPSPTTPVAAGIRWLILIAFAGGLGVIYTSSDSTDFISQLALHIPRLGFIGLGLILSPVALPPEPVWLAPLVLVVVAGMGAWIYGWGQAQRWVGRGVLAGWAALGLALVSLLGQRLP